MIDDDDDDDDEVEEEEEEIEEELIQLAVHPSLAEPAAPIPPTDKAVNAARPLTSLGVCAKARVADKSPLEIIVPFEIFPDAKPLTPLAEVEVESAHIGNLP